MGKQESIIEVRFYQPKNGKEVYYFGSLTAIYEVFTPDEIGCKLYELWGAKITYDNPFDNGVCVISKHSVIRKAQNKN